MNMTWVKPFVDLMNEDGLYYEEAHNIAEHKYNYSKALKAWLKKRGYK